MKVRVFHWAKPVSVWIVLRGLVMMIIPVILIIIGNWKNLHLLILSIMAIKRNLPKCFMSISFH
jgi:uncharacterized membrane protein